MKYRSKYRKKRGYAESIEDRSAEDFYGVGGSFMMAVGAWGQKPPLKETPGRDGG
jgi:hypothetical protein